MDDETALAPQTTKKNQQTLPPSPAQPNDSDVDRVAQKIGAAYAHPAVVEGAKRFLDGIGFARPQLGGGLRRLPFAALNVELGDRDNDGRVDITVSASIAGRELPPLSRNLDLSSGLSLLMAIREKIQSATATRVDRRAYALED